MKYITYKRFKQKSLNGIDLNIPAGSECRKGDSGIIYYNSSPICYSTSQNGHTYFMRNDDGNGMLRGDMVTKIMKTLANKSDNKYQDRWDKIWADILCQPYRRAEFEDYWLWNDNFYNASIDTLNYIYNLIKEV